MPTHPPPLPPSPPTDFPTVRLWIVTVSVVVALIVLGVGLVVMVHPTGTPARGDAALCKEAMRRDFRASAAGSAGPASQPPECVGISDDELLRLASEVLDEEMAR